MAKELSQEEINILMGEDQKKAPEASREHTEQQGEEENFPPARKHQKSVKNFFEIFEPSGEEEEVDKEEVQKRLAEIEDELNSAEEQYSGEDLYLKKGDLFEERRYLKRLLKGGQKEQKDRKKTVSLKEGDRFIPESGKGKVGFRVSSLKGKDDSLPEQSAVSESEKDSQVVIETDEEEPKRYEQEVSVPQLEEHKDKPAEPREVEVPYNPEKEDVPPEDGEKQKEEMSPLDSARLQYIKALKLRGNVFRGKFGRIFNRTLEVGGEKQDFGNNIKGNQALRDLRREYQQELDKYRQEAISAFRVEQAEVPEEERTLSTQTKLLELLEEEQHHIDDVVMNKFEKTLSERMRRRWRSKGGRWTRIGAGIGLGAVVAATGGIIPLVARSILGGFGTYMTSEALFEHTRALGHKGLIDELYKKHKDDSEAIRAALENELDPEAIKEEAARLRMLQIEKGTAIDTSYIKNNRNEAIRLLLERERQIIADTALAKRTEGEPEEEIALDTLMDNLNSDLEAGNKSLESAGEKERHRKMVRKSLAAGLGITMGTVIGTRAFGLFGGGETDTSAVSGSDVDVPQDAFPDTTEVPSVPVDTTGVADSADAAIPEAPIVPETLGIDRIVIDEKGEGMIKVIAQHLEGKGLGHAKAMEIGNLMYVDGLKEYTAIVESLVKGGVDIDALKELEFAITEEGLDPTTWVSRMQDFLETQGVDASLAHENAEALYEDGRMFNLVQLNDSFSLDMSQITSGDLQDLSAAEIVEKIGVDYDSGTFVSTEATPAPNYDLPQSGTESIEAAFKSGDSIQESMLSDNIREDYIEKLKAALKGFDTQQAEYTKGALDIDIRLALAEQEAEYREILAGLLDDSVDVPISKEQWEFYESLESIEAAKKAGVQQVMEKVTAPAPSPEPLVGTEAPQAPEATAPVSSSEIISVLSQDLASETETVTDRILPLLDDVYGPGDGPNATMVAETYSAFSEADAPVTETLKSLSEEKLQFVDGVLDTYVESSQAQSLPQGEQQTIGKLREYINALLTQRGH